MHWALPLFNSTQSPPPPQHTLFHAIYVGTSLTQDGQRSASSPKIYHKQPARVESTPVSTPPLKHKPMSTTG